MNKIEKILLPVDLSRNSLSALEMASLLAKQFDALLVFIYIAPQWLPQESMLGNEFVELTIAENKEQFMQIRPTDDAVAFDHQFSHGNPGPEIVKAAEGCDLVVMTTHGHTGLTRFLMGSVAEYVVRNSPCPVLTLKTTGTQEDEAEPKSEKEQREPVKFVTQKMHHVKPIHEHDKIGEVIKELASANETGAPVVNSMGNCIGILTETDIEKYRDMRQRYENHDESVIDEMFETDKYGQRRASNLDFDQVHRHMTSPVITISNTETCRKACEVFAANPKIHHLIVVDECDRPLGILETNDVMDEKGIQPKS